MLPKYSKLFWLIFEIWLELNLIESPEVVILVDGFVALPILSLGFVGIVLGSWFVFVASLSHLLMVFDDL